jgi:phospholipid/cholesterol/gamma-HCH transport system permease protein
LNEHLRWKENSEGVILEAFGLWETEQAMQITTEIKDLIATHSLGEKFTLDLKPIESIDTFGVISILRLSDGLLKAGTNVSIINIHEKYAELFEQIKQGFLIKAPEKPTIKPLQNAINSMVNMGTYIAKDFIALLDILGECVIAIKRTLTKQTRFHFQAMVRQIDAIAFRAVPIVMLITFLIGAIIAQQGIFHFRSFGADIFVVDMVGVLTLREIGVLIVSIMIAGRTGSAYTAELGSMKMREEVDALRVMGLEPIELLVLPRVLAMIIGLPILTIIGDFSALVGGALVANFYGGISFSTFFDRFQEVVNVRHLWVGLAKAPFMAAVIGLIACVEGMRVHGSAESLGQQTTASVVKSIFMVIVLDGVFAMFFAAMDI